MDTRIADLTVGQVLTIVVAAAVTYWTVVGLAFLAARIHARLQERRHRIIRERAASPDWMFVSEDAGNGMRRIKQVRR